MPEIYDLSSPAHRQLLSHEIKRQIDAFCVDRYSDGPRGHLGASLIGHPCSRYLWYNFRWVRQEKFSGQMYRLFNRGHREEERFVEWLKGAGFEVHEFDLNWLPDDKIKIGKHKDQLIKEVPPEYLEWAKNEGVDLCKKQFRISACNGHFAGSLDGIGVIPLKFVPTGEYVLLEFKTSGTGPKKFGKMIENGLQVAKPQHWAQTCTYGYNYGIKYIVYLMINKDNDDLHVEVEELDWNVGKDMERKAEYIINSKEAPQRACCSASYMNFEHNWGAKYCHFKGICFDGNGPERNCRSCKKAIPIENAEWGCEFTGEVLSKETIKVGCDQWEAVC